MIFCNKEGNKGAIMSRRLKQAEKQARHRVEAALETATDAAAALKDKDPAKTLLELDKIYMDIQSVLKSERDKHGRKSSKSWNRSVLITGVSAGLAVTGSVVAMICLAPVAGIGMVAAVPIIFGGDAITKKRDRLGYRKFNRELSGHREKLSRLEERIENLREDILTHQKAEVAHSDLYGSVLKLPGISGHFSDSAAKSVSQEKGARVIEEMEKSWAYRDRAELEAAFKRLDRESGLD
jgi:hypothetical protein